MNSKIIERIMRIILLIQILFIIVFSHPFALACTVFMASDGDKILVGNNEDYNIPHARVWFFPSKNGQYGRVYFGYDNFRPQGGMNDQGLFFDALLTEKMEIHLSKDKPKFKGDFFDSFLAECATINDVLKLFESYNLEFMSEYQLFFADKTGHSVIIEGDHTIRKTGSYQLATNFLQSRVKNNRYPCEWYKGGCIRYQKAETMLKKRHPISVEYFRDILEATHQYTIGTRTLYSNIYDLKKGLVYLYYLHNFDNEVVIDLKEELAKGIHYYEIPAIFGKKVAYKKKEFVFKSSAFKIFYPSHFKVVKPKSNEVFRAKNSFGGVPILSVSAQKKPQNISLEKIGDQFYLAELEKSGAKPKMISSTLTELDDGTPANEVQFDCVADNNWPIKLSILSTYRNDKLIFVVVQSWVFPESLREYQYSLQFD